MSAALQLTYAMTCAEYLDGWDCGQIVDEMYWGDSYSTDALFEAMKRDAARDGVTLTDADDWSYDRALHEVWRSTEKGLS